MRTIIFIRHPQQWNYLQQSPGINPCKDNVYSASTTCGSCTLSTPPKSMGQLYISVKTNQYAASLKQRRSFPQVIRVYTKLTLQRFLKIRARLSSHSSTPKSSAELSSPSGFQRNEYQIPRSSK